MLLLRNRQLERHLVAAQAHLDGPLALLDVLIQLGHRVRAGLQNSKSRIAIRDRYRLLEGELEGRRAREVAAVFLAEVQAHRRRQRTILEERVGDDSNVRHIVRSTDVKLDTGLFIDCAVRWWAP